MGLLRINAETAGSELQRKLELLDGSVGDKGFFVSSRLEEVDPETAKYADRAARRRAEKMLAPYLSHLDVIPGTGAEVYDRELSISRSVLLFGKRTLTAQLTDSVTIDPFADLNGYNSSAPYDESGIRARYSRSGHLKEVQLYAGGLSAWAVPTTKDLWRDPKLIGPTIRWANDFMESVLEIIEDKTEQKGG